MNSAQEDISLFPIRGRIDNTGHLIEADPPLAALHAESGGRPGGIVAIPQLAALVRLVARLQVAVSRAITAGDEGADVELFVRARPEGDAVSVEIVEWTSRSPLQSLRDFYAPRHQDFARAVADFSWSVDSDLQLTDVSPDIAAALGSTANGLVGQPFAGLFTLIEAKGGRLPMIDAITERKQFANQRAHLRGSDLGLLGLAGIPVTDEQGNFAGYRGTAIRIPETEEIEDADAEAADDRFGIEIGRVLKGPLDRIIASADVIRSQQDGPLRKGYADYASDIAAAGRHLMSLVDDLMELQTIERSDFKPEIESIDLGDIARRAAGLLAVRAADSGVTIDRPGEGENLSAKGEFRRVLQILVNLLGNAVRHSPPGGTIWLRAESEGDTAILIVADQGAGIAPEDHEKVFEKFERLGRNDSSGSGLGLYISRQLARAMGGDLKVDSAPGQGARFILTLKA